ncbi:helix-turn-helix transcriptional regulator [Rhodococcus opacus]|uniref:helix-turn-helix domain-containing protein n=1 Tax=Rhodococcus opacus TaxID=37919 RepID=UPI0002A313CE|nr:helix-turn-helix transcriptional regulator [Rhodococcus opacus]ELB90792.1 hypothetical protein Rwratislav_22572 [Rhodococcus wratislaviensis IFP 2016]MDX5962725.1 helix-turn-helix transcriptional regulator [Rhodococcus opacus]CAG7636862.1 hypothetical protein E143388_07837 [Rhodococcus opacus]
MGQKPIGRPGPETAAIVLSIRHAMIDAGIDTTAELSRRSGLHHITLGRILAGTRRIDLEELVVIAEAFHLRPSELVALRRSTAGSLAAGTDSAEGTLPQDNPAAARLAPRPAEPDD